MAEKKKVTLMLLKVDLGCSKCYKKVKKILCKFPQVQDQMYDEKNNTVMIKVVSCCPEKIRDKICCKGRGTIKSIEILKPPPPKPPPPKPPEEKPPPPPKPAPPPPAPPPPPPPPPPAPAPAPCPVPIGCCCTGCSAGRGGGPCYNPCYGQPVRHYDGYCGRPVYDSWGGGGYRGSYGSRCCEYYFSEDNSRGCTIL
ncbi:hypothetical protein EZV62_009145 [Acer yangbiense]|uniref:HMA domain-containing protein n=1 Tax=Acer yangbiense TaxID=1000413 RepID=A0A5C7IEV5_9ROSI|nr:hypothetical protein EZV62_009145 [Acer yangbiense]